MGVATTQRAGLEGSSEAKVNEMNFIWVVETNKCVLRLYISVNYTSRLKMFEDGQLSEVVVSTSKLTVEI